MYILIYVIRWPTILNQTEKFDLCLVWTEQIYLFPMFDQASRSKCLMESYYFSLFSIRTVVVNSQKKRLNEAALMSILMLKLMGMKIITILRSKRLAYLDLWIRLCFPNLWFIRGCRGGEQGVPFPLGKMQSYRVPKQNWSRSPEKSQIFQASIQCWAIIGPQRNAIWMAFRWRVDSGLLLVVFGSSLRS